MVPDDARVEGVRGHAAAEEPLAQLLGEEDIGQLEQYKGKVNYIF